MNLSIIIPVYNEVETIDILLDSLKPLMSKYEIIIVDGGSLDGTREKVSNYSVKLINSKKGRAKQMNVGAELANGNVLLFLHADTFLPNDISELLSLKDSEKAWGRFDLKLSSERSIFRLIETMINLRSRLTGIATGDQAIFVGKKLFKEVNGYQDIPLMEDVALSKDLRKIAKPMCLKSKVITSSRRWEKFGVLKMVFLMWILRFLYFIGFHPETLSRYYG